MIEQRTDEYDETSPQSAELFHLIVENIKDYAVFMTDAEGVVVSWNPGVERLLGYTESEIVGEPIAIIFTPEDRAAGAHLEEMETAARDGRSEDKRWHLRRDGARFWADGLVMPLKNADGSLRGFAKVMRDDTAQKLAEGKLEESNRRVENILSSITDAFYTFDRDLRYVYVNDATTHMFNLPAEKFLGKTLWDLFPDVEGSIFHREIRQALDERQPRVFENYYPPLDRWFENRVYPSPDGLSVFTSEITTRKRVEEALARLTLDSEQRRRFYETILSNTPDLVYVFGLDHHFTYANDALLAMWGKTWDEAIGKNCLELGYEPWHAEMHGREIEQVKATKQPIRGEVPFNGTQGRRIYDYIFTPVIGEGGEVEAIAGTTRDVTETKQSAEKLLESEQRLGGALSIARLGCYEWNLITDAVLLDERSREIFDFPRAGEVKAEDVFARIHPEDFEQVYAKLTAAENLSRLEIEYRTILPDGATRIVHSVSDVVGENGRAERMLGVFKDLTAQKQAEKALRESEEKYRALIEATSTTVWHANPQGGLTFVGDAWTSVSGQTVEEILKWGWLEALHPDDRERTIEIWQNSLENKTLYSTEFRILTIGGEYRWFAVNAVPILEADSGNVREWVGINTDITARKQAETALRDSEQKFSALAEGVPQLVWMAEADGFIFWYNRNWFEYTGTTAQDMEGWGWQSVHDPKILPQVMSRWQASIENGERFEMEFPLKGAGGNFRWFLTRVNPMRDADGRIVRWFGTNTDIDEQRRTDLRNRFIIEIDEAVRPLETPEEITLTLARLLGEHLGADRCAYAEVEADENHFYIPGDYTKGDTASIVGHYSMADFGAEVLRRMRANESYVVNDVDSDAQVSEADLAAYRLTEIQAVICVPLHKNNRFSACMAVHQKTPRRWREDEIELVSFVANRFWESIERARVNKSLYESLAREQESRRQAEEANRLKDEFLATLSHELRTPLNAILGWSQMLQNNRLGEAETKKALLTIERNARSQNQLIDDILDVSRIITGKLRLDVRAVDLPNVVAAAVDAARPAADAKNIRLQTLLDPDAGPISGDSDRLQQVVWNLLSNAVKFTPKGGRVQVRLERVNSHVEIVISDTGSGIEPEFLPNVFDRFRQSDGSMTRRHGGLGLGLAIVRQLVELHGGTVSVASAGKGEGATFTVSLPLLPVRREPTSDAPCVHPTAENGAALDCPPELTALRVLLVDDEADSRDLLTLVLASCGAQVTTASSASEALATTKREKFDVLISDIGMPDEDGFSLIKRIRELPNEEGGNTPAIALTAYARAEDRVQALRHGFQMHVAKPVEPVELVAIVANLAGRMRNPNRREVQ